MKLIRTGELRAVERGRPTLVLADDLRATGQHAPLECSMRLTGAGREVLRIIPDCER